VTLASERIMGVGKRGTAFLDAGRSKVAQYVPSQG
jgi:hypothetical protein